MSDALDPVASTGIFTPIGRSPRYPGAEPIALSRRRAGSSVRGELSRSRLARERVEHGVDHAALFGTEESGGDIDIFGHRAPRRHIRPTSQFIERRAKDGAHERFDATQRPAFGEGAA